MIENEFVHVFFGALASHPEPDPDEISPIELVEFDELQERMSRTPDAYTYWLRHYLQRHSDAIRDMAAAVWTD